MPCHRKTFNLAEHRCRAPLGRVSALRAILVPGDVVARLFHAASLLREHRGDGHIAALMVEGVGGLEPHVLFALDMDMPAEKFGRIHHLGRAAVRTGPTPA